MLVLILLLCMVTVSASSPGSAEDPLVSRDYLNNIYAARLLTEIRDRFDSVAKASLSRLEDMYRIGYSYAPHFTDIALSAGEAVMLTMGSSFLLLSGSATLTYADGTVINISTGSEVPAGSSLVRHQRYFCTEDTSALITANAASAGQVDGYYRTGATALPPGRIPFTDVARDNWAYPAVEFVFNNNLFVGTSPTIFSPNSSMTRGMFVTVMYRFEGRPPVVPNGGLVDVSNPARYYYEPIIWANDIGIISVDSGGRFYPDDRITREHMADIMHKYAAYKGRDMSSSTAAFNAFPDNGSVSPYALAAMRWAVTWQIIRGSNGRLRPLNSATRAEVAQIFLNYYENIGR